MDMDVNSSGWAQGASVALDHVEFNNVYTNLSASSSTWTIPTPQPPFQTQACIAKHGQITPAENNPPVEPISDFVNLQSSMLPTQPLDDPSLHLKQPLQVLQQSGSPQQTQLQQQTPPNCSSKRHFAVKQAAVGQNHAEQSGHTTAADPQPPKRKRGRPTSRPQPQSSDARQLHLEKNCAAAYKCRQRKKNYVDNLEARGREATKKNKRLKENVANLREEVLKRKYEVLGHGGCNFWAVDEYLARSAGDLLGMDGPLLNHRQYQSPTSSLPSNASNDDGTEAGEMITDSPASQSTTDSPASQSTMDSANEFDILFGNLFEDIDDDA
jgi:hypothetical protein